MKSNSLQEGLRIFLDNNPDLPEGETIESAEPGKEVSKGTLHVVIEKKGHAGKTVTIVEGFDAENDDTESIVKEIKKSLGTGGSFRDCEILLQGDYKEKVSEFLKKKGYKVK